MSFTPKDFYDLALWLISQRGDESSVRSAISRAYYGAHLLACEKLIEKNWWTPTGTGIDHDGVIRALRQRRTRQLGDNLRSLLELREHADYHLDATLSKRNDKCNLCKEIRDSAKSAPEVVGKTHWDEAAVLSGRCIPLLEKL